MNGLYKKLFLENLSSYVVNVRYKDGNYTFEKPFKKTTNFNLGLLMNSPSITMINMIDGTVQEIAFENITQFNVKQQATDADWEKTIEYYKTIFSQFKSLQGKTLENMFCRVDIEDSVRDKLHYLKILDALQLTGLNCYTQLKNNDKRIVDMVRTFWLKKIEERYQETLKSIDQEIKNTTDPAIIGELETIKGILVNIPKEAEVQLSNKMVVADIIDYWPPLLLPRSDIFDVPPM